MFLGTEVFNYRTTVELKYFSSSIALLAKAEILAKILRIPGFQFYKYFPINSNPEDHELDGYKCFFYNRLGQNVYEETISNSDWRLETNKELKKD